MSITAFHSIVEVLRCVMLNMGQDRTKGRWVALGLVYCDPCWPYARLVDCTVESVHFSEFARSHIGYIA